MRVEYFARQIGADLYGMVRGRTELRNAHAEITRVAILPQPNQI
jgi:hypothetical protein